jgi:hypothetical protein
MLRSHTSRDIDSGSIGRLKAICIRTPGTLSDPGNGKTDAGRGGSVDIRDAPTKPIAARTKRNTDLAARLME